ncbi:MAG TPA: ATP synthase F1 subunit epsilon [Phycisphaerales bacterium]|nr:ATP synthase F1 subunit epsilon [Phycisphaerales bacterium]
MVGLSRGKFRVVLLTPQAGLLDCRAGSVVLPGYDGYLGILRNHCPMLGTVSRGIMQVREIPGRADAFFVVEGGFVQVSENHVTVLAYEATTFEGQDEKSIEEMLYHARSVVAGHEYIRSQQEAIDYDKARLIVRMAEMADVKLAAEKE